MACSQWFRRGHAPSTVLRPLRRTCSERIARERPCAVAIAMVMQRFRPSKFLKLARGIELKR
eukprot:4551363-Alexandrium_andersonii.AAC.1